MKVLTPNQVPVSRNQQIGGRPGWRRVRFGDVVRFVKEDADPDSGEFERYVAGEHIETDNLHIRNWGMIGDGYLGPAFHRRFRKGQVLYGSRRTYLRKIAVADFDGITANTTFVLEPTGEELLPALLPFIMQTEAFTQHSVKQSKGSVNPYINFKDIAWFEFALPPIEEQRRIAETLWAADRLASSASSVLAAARTLRERFLIEFFGSLENGKSPSVVEWQQVAGAGKVQLGRQRAPIYQTGKFFRPYLRVANVYDGRLDLTDVLQMDFDDRDFVNYQLRAGDILLVEGHANQAVVGRSAIYNGEITECCFQNTLIRFQCSPRILPKFAHGFFQACLYSGRFAQVASGTQIRHLGAGRFAKMPFPIVSSKAQQELAARLDVISASQDVAHDHVVTCSQLKSRLLRELLEPSAYV
ncbi:MAG: restriction endonuclease subunit S [Limisphaerales bacterium]